MSLLLALRFVTDSPVFGRDLIYHNGIGRIKLHVNDIEYRICSTHKTRFNSSINQIASVVAPVIVGVLITLSYLYSFSVGVVLDIIVTIICYFLIVYGKNPPKEETKKSNKIKLMKKYPI